MTAIWTGDCGPCERNRFFFLRRVWSLWLFKCFYFLRKPAWNPTIGDDSCLPRVHFYVMFVTSLSFQGCLIHTYVYLSLYIYCFLMHKWYLILERFWCEVSTWAIICSRIMHSSTILRDQPCVIDMKRKCKEDSANSECERPSELRLCQVLRTEKVVPLCFIFVICTCFWLNLNENSVRFQQNLGVCPQFQGDEYLEDRLCLGSCGKPLGSSKTTWEGFFKVFVLWSVYEKKSTVPLTAFHGNLVHTTKNWNHPLHWRCHWNHVRCWRRASQVVGCLWQRTGSLWPVYDNSFHVHIPGPLNETRLFTFIHLVTSLL